MPGTPTVPRIHKSSTPRFPQFGFEWHEASQKVYLLEIPGRWAEGEFVQDESVKTINALCIAEHCETHALFFGFVQTWFRGYRKGKSDENVGGVYRG